MLGELCLGTVYHHRLRPREHRFDYGVFYLRLPLRALAVAGWSSRLLSYNHRNLLSIHDADHGDGVTPLLDWINTLLTKQGIHDADGEIWLQTFPRVLGYVFNPVSFWFCQRRDGSLRAVLCEVNNTFGERHLYLLDISGNPGAALQAKKTFHVSPFFPVEGEYRFDFQSRTVAENTLHIARVDYYDAEGVLLRTHIRGTAHPLTDGALARAMLRYPLMTWMVIARIHWQALRLWLKGIHFFTHPNRS